MNIILFIIGIVFGSFGGILMKSASSTMPAVDISSFHQAYYFFSRMFTNPTMLSGIALYFASTLIWMYLLTRLPISFVQPILALTYVITPILAIFLLHESVSVARWIGIMVILFGVFLVARS